MSENFQGLEFAWVLTWDAGKTLKAEPAVEHFSAVNRAFLDRAWPARRAALGVFPSLEVALEHGRRLKRIVAKEREQQMKAESDIKND
jgi:hypothetical protein